jgi:hypothetical protein
VTSYTDDYRTLGVSPNSTVSALRAARRRLVKTWHPDRFPDSGMKRQAEERIKDINTAFDRLIDYYDKFGSLPAHETSDAMRESIIITEPTPSADNRGQRKRSFVFDAEPATDRDVLRATLLWATIVAALVVGIAAYLAVPPDDRAEPPNSASPAAPAPSAEPTQAPSAETKSSDLKPARHKHDEYFTIGSSLGEVYAIQGIPTSTANGVWHYGKSSVYFTDGAVSSWEEDPANPLRASLVAADAAKKIAPTFTFGSTKNEVRAAEGAPLVETAEVWDYGLSKVYFRDDRVVGWESSPMRPLKARK